MSVKLVLLCMAAAAGAVEVDFEDWKRNYVARVYTKRVQPLYQSSGASLDKCFDAVEDTASAKIVQYHNETKTCMLFKKFSTTNDTYTAKSDEWSLYFEYAPAEDDSISTGGIIATIVLSIAFLLCLVGLALVCKSEESDIAAQMDRLEQQEMEKEEAVSEHWEKKSHEAEAAAEKEMVTKQ
eukprot:TRINITY_DN3424_c0_g1_i1.p2 TRINITY_DN3424_c0_g1~~TRINITY_DN3424_c0_g1_i1.p2  ORF type:complete len:182 (+),score=122.60 TRINITY_DN3424_c0_g1_i1:65-610(+)